MMTSCSAPDSGFGGGGACPRHPSAEHKEAAVAHRRTRSGRGATFCTLLHAINSWLANNGSICRLAAGTCCLVACMAAQKETRPSCRLFWEVVTGCGWRVV